VGGQLRHRLPNVARSSTSGDDKLLNYSVAVLSLRVVSTSTLAVLGQIASGTEIEITSDETVQQWISDLWRKPFIVGLEKELEQERQRLADLPDFNGNG